MPYERPGQGYYAVATKVTPHGAACVEDGVVGVAIKQKAPSWNSTLAQQNSIGIGEAFHIRTKGVKQIPFVASCVKGDMLWIVKASNVVQRTATGAGLGYKLGLVVEIQNQRGTPNGYMRVDLDQKDQAAT